MGIDLPNGTKIRKGAFDSIRNLVTKAGNIFPAETAEQVKLYFKQWWYTAWWLAENNKVLGVIELQDIIKPGIQERFERLRKMGVKT